MGKDLRGKELGRGLTQLKDGRYIGRFTGYYGKREIVYGQTAKEAREKLNAAKYKDQLMEGSIPQKNSATLQEVYRAWIQSKKDRIRPTTLGNYQYLYTAHFESIGMCKVSRLNHFILEEHFNNMYENGLAPNTIVTAKTLLASICKFAVDEKYCTENPFQSFTMPKAIRDALMSAKVFDGDVKFLTREQRTIFVEYVDTHKCNYANLYKLLMYTGLRIGEAVALQWDCVNLDENCISVKRNCVEYKLGGKQQRKYDALPKTPSSIRKIPLCIQARKILKEQREKTGHFDSFVFLKCDNTPLVPDSVELALRQTIKTMNKGFEAIAKTKGETPKHFPKITPHYFRHTFATICLEQGIHPKIVQKYMGHSKINMTMDIYSHVSIEHASGEINKINGVV